MCISLCRDCKYYDGDTKVNKTEFMSMTLLINVQYFLCFFFFFSDNGINITGRFYPFGTGDTVNERSDDGSSSVIYLQQPFIFFGQSYNQIYVSQSDMRGSWIITCL